MIFNSVTFLLFLVCFVCAYWLLGRRARLLLIFAGSLVFYGFWRIEFIPVMLASVATDYLVALGIHRSRSQSRRLVLLTTSLAINLGLLGFFKYTYFVVENVNGLAALFGLDEVSLAWQIILPLGISFYTFQSISYTLDVYRGFIKPERDPVLFGCYVMFFPQLVAGPILRAREVIWQLDKRPSFNLVDLAAGIRRILCGLFLKVVLADPIGGFVDAGFAVPVDTLGAIDVWTLALLFGFQIYFDFSAYSHIAIGAARLMGVRFPENFDFPYLAISPRDFWRRWHISLSSWIRDYLYLPLCGQQVYDQSTGGLAAAAEPTNETRRATALFGTWVLMGLWHGAHWNFAIWGLWHAALIMAHRLIAPLFALPPKFARVAGWAVTLPLVMLGWIPFRAQSVEDATTMLLMTVTPSAYGGAQGTTGIATILRLELNRDSYYVAALVLALALAAGMARNYLLPGLAGRKWLRWGAEAAAFSVVVAAVFVFLRPINQFIYFQF